jgi:peptidoglycan/LPS O-acetylase OafA/YrhL
MALTDRPAAPTAVEARFPCFDGLRALAALAVLMTHVAFAGGANAPNLFGVFFARMDGGVAVFFVLSGVLIYRPFARAHLFAEPSPAVRSYLWRRAIRIYPAYWLAMTFVVYVFGATHIPSLRNWLLDYSLLHIYSPHQQDAFGPLLQSWTLSTELTFYAFVPLWALLMRRLARGDVRSRIRAQLTGVLVLVAVSALWKAIVLSAGLDDARIGQLKLWLPWWLDMFAVGMALAVLSLAVAHLGDRPPLRLDGRLAPLVCWLGALGALWWVSVGAGLGHTTPAIAHHLLWGQHYLYAAVAVLLVLPAVFGPQDPSSSRIRAFLQTRVMVFLGTISYGVYLWHEGWIDRYLSWTNMPPFGTYTSDIPFRWHTNSLISIPWFTFVLAVLGLTVVSATVSWYVWERPILRLKHLFDR